MNDVIESLERKLKYAKKRNKTLSEHIRTLEKEVATWKATCKELESHLRGSSVEVVEENDESVEASTLLSEYWKEFGPAPVPSIVAQNIAALSGKANVHESRRRAM